mmetsp:Transcript_27425/g.79033  ORF Transcript_27425/g.79033 Transcript_27425/m.79033 type:complete len:394 (+) Transcript_27425:59-1240(+)
MSMRLASTAASVAVLASSSVAAAASASASASTSTVIKSGSIKSNSLTGQRILSQATREDAPGARILDEEQQAGAYVANYSLKFQGCHEITQWNGDADGDEDVRVSTKRLVRFRLCPTDSCQDENSAGCGSGYGDYVMDMNTFLEAYLQGVEDEKEYQCQVYEEKCDDQCDGQDDDACDQACLTGYGMSECYEGEDGAFDLMDYVQCAEWAGDDGGRRLEDNGNQYFVGPYCGDQGGAIHLGLFTDDTCTTFSSSNSFYALSGYELPYSDQNLVNTACMSCQENADDDNDNDADDVAEMCETMYQMSGKCETNMNLGGYATANEAACTYIEGVKIIREGGVIRTSTTKKSKGAAIVIGLFTTTAVLLGAYVYYLRTKLGRAKINLSAGGGGAYA